MLFLSAAFPMKSLCIPWGRTPTLWFSGCFISCCSSLMRAWELTGWSCAPAEDELQHSQGFWLLLQVSACSVSHLGTWLSVTSGVSEALLGAKLLLSLSCLQTAPGSSGREPEWGMM